MLLRIDHSEWGAPIVAVPKTDGKFRICGDYKVTVNPVLQVDQYPLPKPEDLFATLAGGKKFTTLDLSQAYLQLELDEQSSQYTTINTHRVCIVTNEYHLELLLHLHFSRRQWIPSCRIYLKPCVTSMI